MSTKSINRNTTTDICYICMCICIVYHVYIFQGEPVPIDQIELGFDTVVHIMCIYVLYIMYMYFRENLFL